uniref:tRNA modification GTPase MnmE n=1 Tax=uncultured Planctomycetota bacterium TaxID=120965 RepID=H5SDM8_9BACT|nr:tRNA modification GTPase [uncultured Planctomycetota bacterium]
MWQQAHDTIAAVATAFGRGARQIIRISGPEAWQAVKRVVLRESLPLEEPFQPVVIATYLAWEGLPAQLPCDVFYWPSGRSYTGQSVVEIHTVCCGPLAQEIIARLKLRPARPGEFTLRAFLNGRLDLTQAEAVLGVVEAREVRDLQIALQQLAGGIGGPLRALREELLNLVADVEAGLDFAEEDLPFLSWEELETRVTTAGRRLEEIRRQFEQRGGSTELPRVVLVGPPNAGKSTLFNALLSAERAIVSPVPGTTRDYLTAVCTHRGISFELVDTAGLESWSANVAPSAPDSTKDTDTSIGVGDSAIAGKMEAATQQAAETADLQLVCWDVTQYSPQAVRLKWNTHYPRTLLVLTKADLLPAEKSFSWPEGSILVSARHNCGLEALKDAIVSRLVSQQETSAGVVAVTAMRCRDALQRAADSLQQAQELIRRRESEDFIATALRSALSSIGEITGEVYSEEILTRIFSRFCIGK